MFPLPDSRSERNRDETPERAAISFSPATMFLMPSSSVRPRRKPLKEMTRFLLSLDRAVDTVFDALQEGGPGETYIPVLPSALIRDLADALIGDRPIEIEWVGIRPGEKIHEILVSEEEAPRTFERGLNLVILPLLPELRSEPFNAEPLGGREYSSANETLEPTAVLELLRENKLMLDDAPVFAA